MKKFISVVVVILSILSFTALAGNGHGGHSYGEKKPVTTSSARAEARAKAEASASAKADQKQQQSQSQTLTVNGGNNNGGSASAVANPVVNNNPTVNAGASLSNTIEASKAIPGTYNAPGLMGAPPELFPGIQAKPVNIADIKDYRILTSMCGPVFSGTVSPIIKDEGASGITNVLLTVFNRGNENMMDEPDSTVLYADEKKHSVVCLGKVTVMGNPKSGYSADISAIEADAGMAVNKYVKIKTSDTEVTVDPRSGKSGKYIWMIPIEAVYVLGVQNSGTGKSGSGSGSHVNGVTVLGIGITVGGSDGYVYPDAKLGGTYYLFAPLKEGVSGGTTMTFTNFSNVRSYINDSVSVQ